MRCSEFQPTCGTLSAPAPPAASVASPPVFAALLIVSAGPPPAGGGAVSPTSAGSPDGAPTEPADAPSSSVIRLQAPASSARPGWPGASALPSNSHCMPTQMPSMGRPRAMWSRMAARQSAPRAAVTSKLPTPGTMTPAAAARSFGAAGVVIGAPRWASALRTDVRFPAP